MLCGYVLLECAYSCMRRSLLCYACINLLLHASIKNDGSVNMDGIHYKRNVTSVMFNLPNDTNVVQYDTVQFDPLRPTVSHFA